MKTETTDRGRAGAFRTIHIQVMDDAGEIIVSSVFSHNLAAGPIDGPLETAISKCEADATEIVKNDRAATDYLKARP